jgi:urease accessory protein
MLRKQFGRAPKKANTARTQTRSRKQRQIIAHLRMATMYSSDTAVAPTSSDNSLDRASNDLLATLSLGFELDCKTTRLTKREHFGPLRVQKALYPEDPMVAHAIIIHPPGGVVGGDELRMNVHAGNSAQALLATPGASKWYRGNGRVSRQLLDISIASDAAVEWLPQETILFDHADVTFDTRINIDTGGRYLGSEIFCFGRTASGERFTQGRVRQHLSVRLGGKLLWLEQGSLLGGSDAMHGPLGLAGHTVCASMVCVGGPLKRDVLEQVREACAPLPANAGQFGATQMKSLISLRFLGDSSEVARQVMIAAWQVLRPALLHREATELRIWNT